MTSRARRAPSARHLFLKSRIARRIFWVLLAAALLPTALSAVLVQRAFVAREDAQAQHEAKERLKQIGLRLYDRLDAARMTLAVHAAMADWRQPAALDRHGRMHLHHSHDGRRCRRARAVVAGQGWRRRARPRLEPGHRAPGASRRHRPRVVDRRAVAPSTCGPTCAATVPAPPSARAHRRDARGARRAARRGEHRVALFLRAGFGAADWRIVGLRRAARAGEAGAADAAPLARLVGLALAATLLVAALLGLVMVRRTLVPLEHLTAGIAGCRAAARAGAAARRRVPGVSRIAQRHGRTHRAAIGRARSAGAGRPRHPRRRAAGHDA
ncbi:MAG: hypothetical protein U1F25_01460 [Rubrivivax sp.]